MKSIRNLQVMDQKRKIKAVQIIKTSSFLSASPQSNYHNEYALFILRLLFDIIGTFHSFHQFLLVNFFTKVVMVARETNSCYLRRKRSIGTEDQKFIFSYKLHSKFSDRSFH